MNEDTEATADAEAPASDDATKPEPKNDLIPRSEAQKAFQARDELKKQNRDLAKRLEELESQAAQQSGDLSKQFELKDRKIAELSQLLAEADAREEAAKKAVVQRDFMDSTLEGVPASHQALAREVLEARILRGEYEIGSESDIKALGKRAQRDLAKSHPQLFEEGPVPSTRTAGVQLDADAVSSWYDIPPDERQQFSKRYPQKTRELLRKLG